MKNAKKMILVEADRLSQTNNFNSDLNVKSKPLFHIDEEINKILNSDENINDKLRKYFYALNRFLFFKQQENKYFSKEREIDSPSSFDTTELVQEAEYENKSKDKEVFNIEKTPQTPKTPQNANNVLQMQKKSKKKEKKKKQLRSPINTRSVAKELEEATSGEDEEKFGTPEKTNLWLSPFKKIKKK